MRKSDKLFIGFVVLNCFVLSVVTIVYAQGITQDYINGGNIEKFAALNTRLDHLENLANAAIVALILNFIAQVVQLSRNKRQRS